MDEREINPIIRELKAGLKGRPVRYLYADNLHQFIVEGNGPQFHIYIHHKFFEEEDPMEILNEFYKYHVIETLSKATKPIWLYLSITGLQEVDENFSTQKPS